MESKQHWDRVYESKTVDQLSWTQDQPRPSLDWIKAAAPSVASSIIDVGGGNSQLVDFLLAAGYERPLLVDISEHALAQAKARLGQDTLKVDWAVADITSFVPGKRFDLWHDRAVFHFLTSASDCEKYREVLRRSLKPGGKIIIATFSDNGPEKCSGLTVARYDEAGLVAALGEGFLLLKAERHLHHTPWGASQEFVYGLFEKQGS